MKTKKINQYKRLKKEIDILKRELSSSIEESGVWRGKYNELRDITEKQEGNYRIDIRSMSNENRWLRDLVELVVIPKENFKALDEIRKDRSMMRGRV